MGKSVLICDDAAFARMVLRNVVEKSGYLVAGEAQNGYEAVAMYNELHPDLVIMDVVMPIMSGIQAVQAIMQMDPKAKVIMCSSIGQQSAVIESIKAGAKDFIVKPYKESRITEALKCYLEGGKTMPYLHSESHEDAPSIGSELQNKESIISGEDKEFDKNFKSMFGDDEKFGMSEDELSGKSEESDAQLISDDALMELLRKL